MGGTVACCALKDKDVDCENKPTTPQHSARSPRTREVGNPSLACACCVSPREREEGDVEVRRASDNQAAPSKETSQTIQASSSEAANASSERDLTSGSCTEARLETNGDQRLDSEFANRVLKELKVASQAKEAIREDAASGADCHGHLDEAPSSKQGVAQTTLGPKPEGVHSSMKRGSTAENSTEAAHECADPASHVHVVQLLECDHDSAGISPTVCADKGETTVEAAESNNIGLVRNSDIGRESEAANSPQDADVPMVPDSGAAESELKSKQPLPANARDIGSCSKPKPDTAVEAAENAGPESKDDGGDDDNDDDDDDVEGDNDDDEASASDSNDDGNEMKASSSPGRLNKFGWIHRQEGGKKKKTMKRQSLEALAKQKLVTAVGELEGDYTKAKGSDADQISMH